MKSNIKKIVIILVIVGALLAVYFLFLQPDESSQGSLTSSSGNPNPASQNTQEDTTAGNAVNQELVALLTSLQEINLSGAIFENAAFRELNDISMPLMREGNEGRRNPFSPIGSDPVITNVSNSNVQSGQQSGGNATNETNDEAPEDEEPQELDIFGLPVQ